MTPTEPGNRSKLKLVVFGATGATGRKIIELALAEGHIVVGVARRPDALSAFRGRIEIVQADVVDPGCGLDEAIEGADAVLSALGERQRRPTTVYSEGMRRITTAMNSTDVRRLLCISSDGIEIPDGLFWGQRMVMPQIIRRLYRHAYADMVRMEAELKSCPLDWTLVRAPRLVDGPSTGRIRMSIDDPILDGGSLRRSDLAQFMIDAISQTETFQRTVHLASPRK